MKTNNKFSFIKQLKTVIMNNLIIGEYYKKKSPNTKYSLDQIIENIIYVLKTGISWRNLNINPNIKWQTIYFHFNRFIKNNIFKTFFFNLRNKYIKTQNSAIKLIDSSFILNKYGRNKISRNKFFKNKNCNKISVLTDVYGIPLSVIVNKGTIHDSKFFDYHYNDIKFMFKHKNKYPHYLLADKAYESNKIRNILIDNNYRLMVAPKKNIRVIHYFYKNIYKKRIFVEHTFQKLKAFKRIQIRYDFNINTYHSFVYLASSILISRKFN